MKKLLIVLLVSILFVSESVAQAPDRSASIVTIDGKSYYVHNVDSGETLYSLSRLYGVTESDIKRENPMTAAEGLRAGQTLKIPLVQQEVKLTPRKRRQLYDTHTIKQGETLYGISRQYEISVNTLLEDNPGLDPAALQLGTKINIRKAEQGDATPQQIEDQLEQYRSAANRVTTSGIYHLVQSGETIYGLSRLYDVAEEDIIRENNIRDGLKSGDMIRIPVADPAPYRELTQGMLADTLARRDSLEDHNRAVARREEWLQTLSPRDVSSRPVLDVRLFLPFAGGSEAGTTQFLDFYQGFLLGLEDVKREGISAEVTLYDSERSPSRVLSIIDSPDFGNPDLIFGPVYEEELEEVLELAEDLETVVVSPLAVMEGYSSPILYQMAPHPSARYRKLLSTFPEDANLIYLSTTAKDHEMETDLRPLLPYSTKFIEYSNSVTGAALQRMLERDRENIFIVSASNELTVDQILAKISSMLDNMTARTGMTINVRVVGNSRWMRFRSNVDRELYFRLNLCYVASYHADRSDSRVYKFDSRYITAFGNIPSLYSYRGYDAAKLFITAAKIPGSDFTWKLNGSQTEMLEVEYNFEQVGANRSFVNTNWPVVRYRNDYTIEVL